MNLEEVLCEFLVPPNPFRFANLSRFKWLDTWKGTQVVHINFWWGIDSESGQFEDR